MITHIIITNDMIGKLRFKKTSYSGIDRYFPVGAEMDVSRNVVMVLGPMGSGKTGMLRMLATSIENIRTKRKRPKNKYDKVYIEPVVGHSAPIYTLGFNLSRGEVGHGYQIAFRKKRPWYWEFDPSYHGNQLVNRWEHFVVAEATDEIKGDPKEKRRYEGSPGLTLYQRIESTFDQISSFFHERKHPVQVREEMKSSGWDEEDHKPKFENVPENGRLAVFMEHPVIHLDYYGKNGFLDMLVNSIEIHGDALQFFIVTHDYFLINNVPNCMYINMYGEPPAKSQRTFSPPV